MSEKQVLLYGLGNQEKAIAEVLACYQAEGKIIGDDQLEQTVGFLCVQEAGGGETGIPESEAMQPAMLFCGVPQEELNEILGQLQKKGLGRGVLKAVVTPTNRNWTFRALLGEIQQEQQVMAALVRLKKYRSQMVNLNPFDAKMMSAVMRAEQLLSGTEEVTVEAAESAYQMLREAYER